MTLLHTSPNSKRPARRLVVIALIIFFTALAALITTYIYKFDQVLREENKAQLSEVSDYVATHMDTAIRDTQRALVTVSHAVVALDSDAARMDFLQRVARIYSFAYMGYAGSDGALRATMDSESGDVSGEPYFQAATQGKNTVSDQVRKIFTNRAASGILIAVPLRQEGQNGVLVAMLETRNLKNSLGLESFGGEGYSYIIDRHGDVLMRTRSLDFGNLFTAWKDMHFLKGYSLQRMADDVATGHENLTSFANMVGATQYAYYRPLPFNNWMVVNVVSEQAVAAKTTMLTRQLAAVSGVTLIVFMGLMLWGAHVYREAEENRLATDAKSAFLANMSHEIRTPMNVIVGLSEIMLRGDVSPRQREQLMNILNSGKGLLTIISDILDISKIEAGKFTLVEETYELESVLYDLATIVALRVGDKPVDFLLDLDPALPRHLVGDMGRVKQVLLNIVGNAIKFTQRGSIRLNVAATRDKDGWLLRMVVRDTGIGIREEDLPKLFISFNQIDTRRNRNVEGTGLGLSISRQLCEMMHGSIEVSSEYDKGSTFTITLRQQCDGDDEPMIRPVEGNVCLLAYEESPDLRDFESSCLSKLGVNHALCETAEEFKVKLATGGYTHALAARAILHALPSADVANVHLVGLLGLREFSLIDMGDSNIYLPLFEVQLPYALNNTTANRRLPKRAGMSVNAIEPMPFVSILIVDDNEVNVQVAEGLMTPYGMRIDHASSGRDAIRAVQTHDYDMVLMDHMMPEMDGVEATRQIRELPDEKFHKLPIVALTANVTTEARRLFLQRGFDGFLAKPMETEKLNRVLKTWLKEINDQRAAACPATAASRLDAGIPKKLLPQVGKIQATDVSTAPCTEWDGTEIDFREGLKRMTSLSAYTKLLALYLRSAGETLTALPDWMQNAPERVTIEVHGLKSASQSIGAASFAKAASQLEEQGRSKNFDHVAADLPAFLEQGQRVLAEIENFLTLEHADPHGHIESSNETTCIPLTADMLDELESAFAHYDTSQLKKLLGGWRGLVQDERARELLEQLQHYLDTFEFHLPLELIRGYRQTEKRLLADNEARKKHVVIVDDNPVNLELAENVLNREYRVTTLISGEQLLSLLERVTPDIILLDIRMTGMDGYETLDIMRKNPAWSEIPVIFLTGQKDIPSEREGFRLGAKDFISKPFDNVVMLSRVRSQLELYSYQTELKNLITEKTHEIEELQHVITVSWAEIIESRDGTTGSHVRNTTRYFQEMLEILHESQICDADLSAQNASDLLRASSLHDIGKIGISDMVLKKPASLTPDEFAHMKLHSQIGADMIQKIIDNTRPDRFLLYARDMALYHHERWDGTGYPRGLRGEEIPFFVRVLTIADVFEALTAVRPYKRAFNFAETLDIMSKDRGKFYSPELFDIFMENRERMRRVLDAKPM